MILGHAALFLLSAAVIWVLSGMLVDATARVAQRYNKPGFAVAFFILGFLTSISEISVAMNSTVENVPQVSAGNLMGASLVIFLFIIPLLSVLGNGVKVTHSLVPANMILALFVVSLPGVMMIDGEVSPKDGVLMLLMYAALVYRIRKKHPTEKTAKDALKHARRELLHRRKATIADVFKIALGAGVIFVAGNVLVEESVFFARLLSIPVSFIGLLILSIGTNIPELVIALRCVYGKHKDIAFGDYMGSAVANTPIFGLLAISNGTFLIEQSEAALTLPLLVIGLVLFYFFARTKGDLSRGEGLTLLIFYVVFLLLQVSNAYRLSGSTREPIDNPTSVEGV